MLLLLSGEGAADIGAPCQMHEDRLCEPDEWIPGPMAHFVDKEYEKHLNYSALGTRAWFASKKLLGCVGKSLSQGSLLLGPGKGHTLFRRNAQALACLALALSLKKENKPVLAVLFRDCDGTRTAPSGHWQERLESMRSGFDNLGFQSGTPMLPRPKSEAWLLCAIKNKYEHCDALEDAPGNDGSPKSLKASLDKAMPNGFDLSVILEWIKSGEIDISRVNMPSVRAFRHGFSKAIDYAREDNWPPSITPSINRVVRDICRMRLC